MKSASDQWFDEAYYQRYYFDKKTSVIDPAHAERLGDFVCSYLKYLRVPVLRVLDVGCGIGLWRKTVAKHFPEASYHGVEFSAYLCERFGWERDVIDDELADPRLFRHRAELYRRGLQQGFTDLGGGVWLSRKAEVPLFELECAGSR